MEVRWAGRRAEQTAFPEAATKAHQRAERWDS